MRSLISIFAALLLLAWTVSGVRAQDVGSRPLTQLSGKYWELGEQAAMDLDWLETCKWYTLAIALYGEDPALVSRLEGVTRILRTSERAECIDRARAVREPGAEDHAGADAEYPTRPVDDEEFIQVPVGSLVVLLRHLDGCANWRPACDALVMVSAEILRRAVARRAEGR